MKIDTQKQEVVVGLRLELGLSDLEVGEAAKELPKQGKVGQTALDILRALGSAVDGLETSAKTLVLSLDTVTKTDPNHPIKASVQLEFLISEIPTNRDALLSTPLKNLRASRELDFRSYKCFCRLGLETLGDLIDKTADDLLESKNFGPTSLHMVRQLLDKLGLKLKGE